MVVPERRRATPAPKQTRTACRIATTCEAITCNGPDGFCGGSPPHSTTPWSYAGNSVEVNYGPLGYYPYSRLPERIIPCRGLCYLL